MTNRMQKYFKENNFENYGDFLQSLLYGPIEKLFNIRISKQRFDEETWKGICFETLGLKGKAKLLLNPFDQGFSREFGYYGFREPLNTYATFRKIEAKNNVILDVGSNLGYFVLIALQAGAEQVIAVEPVPSTFAFLSRTLKDYANVTLLNMAVSDKREELKLYVANERNVTSSSKQLLSNGGHRICEQRNVKATCLAEIAHHYPFNAIRMDVEGHEYRILKGEIPDYIETIFIELHTLPPFSKIHTTKLLRDLSTQGFKAAVVITEIDVRYYPLVKYLGLKNAYNLLTSMKGWNYRVPKMELDLPFNILLQRIPKRGQIHLILER